MGIDGGKVEFTVVIQHIKLNAMRIRISIHYKSVSPWNDKCGDRWGRGWAVYSKVKTIAPWCCGRLAMLLPSAFGLQQ